MELNKHFTKYGYRISNWAIRIDLSPVYELWMHGYTGAVDIIEKSELIQPGNIINEMEAKGYVTKSTIHQEESIFLKKCDEFRGVDEGSLNYVFQYSLECNFMCPYCFEKKTRIAQKCKEDKINTKVSQMLFASAQ